MIEEKQTIDDSMAGMFAHGNEAPKLPPVEDLTGPLEAETAPADRARDDQGRLASPEAAKPAVVPPPATPAVITTDADPEKQPITKAEFKGMLEEREKRQKAEKEAKELRARIQQFESQQQQPQLPSASDPQALAQYIDQQRTSLAFDMSETMAREKHGDEPVSQAMDWALQRAQQSPAFAGEYLKQKHPIDWAVKQHKRDAVLQQVGDDPDAFVRRRWAEMNPTALPQTDAPPSQAASPQPAPIPQQQATAPPRSIANAPSAGGAQVVPPTGEFAALDLVHKH